MAKPLEKQQAHALRRQGESIRDIAEKLNVSKSTVSFWCRDISLNKKQIRALEQKSLHAGRKKCLELGETKRNNRLQKRAAGKASGAQSVTNISKRELYFLGLGLYWGEGYKNSNDEFGFTNSDPTMIAVYIQWLEQVFNIHRDRDLILRVGINAVHQGREGEIKKYWSDTTKVSLQNFTKTSYIQSVSKKVYSNTSAHFGTLRVKVRRGSLHKFHVLGAIDAIPSVISK